MTSGNSPKMGRWLALFLAVASVLLAAGVGLAQSAGRTLRPGTRSFQAQSKGLQRPLSYERLNDLPLQRMSLEQAKAGLQSAKAALLRGGKGANGLSASDATPPATTPQFSDLTTNPRPPVIGPSTKSQELHPFWSWDQRTIYFASNNVDPIENYGASLPPTGARFHIYRMSSDGSFLVKVTDIGLPDEASGSQLYPALNHAQTQLAYVQRPTAGDPYQLYVLDLNTGERTQLTNVPGGVLGNPLNSQIVNVEHPAWAPGDNNIAFAARNRSVTGDVRNLYRVDIVTRVVTRITNATPASGVECFDPVYVPRVVIGGQRITFAANVGNPALGNPINVGTGDLRYVKNPLTDQDGNGSAAEIDRNLFIVPELGPRAAAPVEQLTTDIADDIEPAYAQNGASGFDNYLAWSSRGRRPAPSAARGGTYDIYYNDGSTEGADTPIRLFSPDSNEAGVPLNRSDERYPTWSSSPTQTPGTQPALAANTRIAFSSNRQQNVNNPRKPTVSATDTDIWAAEATDVTPPTLFAIGDESLPYIRSGVELGEVLHIANGALPNKGRRIGNPGDTFYFYAKLQDLQYGIESAWIQIKDPDGPSTDFEGENHKLFGIGWELDEEGEPPVQYNSFIPLTELYNVYSVRWHPVTGGIAPDHFLHLSWETDFAAIGVNDYKYYDGQLRWDYATGLNNSRFPTLEAGVDDAIRWSGNQTSPYWTQPGNAPWNPTPISNRPPNDGNGNPLWLKLHDDGVFPDQVKNDGIFSASWVTPQIPSDYYVDLIAYDNAFNPQVPSQKHNWIIYDNIWGFSTQSFVSRNPVLYVDDNGSGQKWPRGLQGAFRAFPEFRFGHESEVTDRAAEYRPYEVHWSFSGPNPGPDIPIPPVYKVPLEDPGASGATGGARGETYDFLTGNAEPYDRIQWFAPGTEPQFRGFLRAYRYDMWRILAKGPLPEAVLTNYAPNSENQPGDIQGTPAKIIKRLVPRRAVVWNAPYTGDVFLGYGSILDQITQNKLTQFRNRGGRLIVAGGDILWALTVNGQVPQAFVQNVLGANFIQDQDNSPTGNSNAFISSPLALDVTQDAAEPAARNFRPGTATPPYWSPFFDPDTLGTPTFWPAIFINPPSAGNDAPQLISADGIPFQPQDLVSAGTGWTQVYTNRMLVNADAASQSKTAFYSFSIGSFARRYAAETDNLTSTTSSNLNVFNYKQKVSHATLCWMFSVDLSGQVRSVQGNGPVAGAWVQAYQNGQLVGSAFSNTDGSYQIRGLPVGTWDLRVDSPGFLYFAKATFNGAHGLDAVTEDILLTPAAPGSISGTVRDQDGEPIGGVRVRATLQAPPLYTGQREFDGVTQLDGTYSISNLPAGNYDVVLVPPFPTNFANPQPATQTVAVAPAQNTPNVNFTLTGQPGPLKVTVFAGRPDGTRAGPLADAEVTLQDRNGVARPGFTANTNAQGVVNFTNVPAGPGRASAFKFGYQEGSVVIRIPQTNAIEIVLLPAVPRDVYGLAVRQIDNQPLGENDIRPAVKLTLLRSPSRLPTPRTATVFAPPNTTPVQHNYKMVAQEGDFLIALRDHPRFFDAQVAVGVTDAAVNRAPNLVLQGRPGIVTGLVRESRNGTPGNALSGATVILTSKTLSPGTVVATETTNAAGRWTTDPDKVPSDLYDITVRKFGYATKTVPNVFVAGDTDTGVVLLDRGPRGQIYGLVQRGVDDAPRGGVKIEFWTAAGSVFGQQKVTETISFLPARPGPDGQPHNYSAGSTNIASEFLPEGDYELRIDDPRFTPVRRPATVQGGRAVRVDIDLAPVAGILKGVVREEGPGGAAGAPIAGATVRVTRDGTLVANLVTNANGEYQTTQPLQPALHQITASKLGFFDNSITVFIEGATTAPTILLRRVPPSTVRGLIRSTLDNALIAGARVEAIPTGGTTPVAVATSTAAATGTPPGNYTLVNVPPGTYIIRASKTGWKTAQRTLTVLPQQNPVSINLSLEPNHVFGRGLLLVALPFDAPGQDAAALFDKPSNTFKSAYWLTQSNRYAIYPEAPAREFRLGKGMFVRFPTATAFTKGGNPAPAADFPIPVRTGWNLIGSVRTTRIAWLSVKVRTADGRIRTLQEAMDDGIIQNGLFGYVDGYFRSDYLEPYAGYFMRSFQDCTLLVPNESTGTSLRTGSALRMNSPQMSGQITVLPTKNLLVGARNRAELPRRTRVAPLRAARGMNTPSVFGRS